MSVRTVAEKLVELCNQGKHFEFMRGYYAPEIVSVEGDGVFGSWLKREGIAPERMLGRPWTEIIPEGTGEYNTAGLRALAGKRVTFEWTMDGVDGLRHFLTSLSPRLGANGEVTGLVGISREVTDQKRVQAQLLVADRMFSAPSCQFRATWERWPPASATRSTTRWPP